MFDLRIVAPTGLPEELLLPGKITVMGNQHILGRYAHKIYNDLLKGVDITSTYYKYDLKINNEYENNDPDSEFEIMAPLPDLITGVTDMVVTRAKAEDLGLAAVEIINEIERQTKEYIQTFIALFSLGAPEEFRELVEIFFDRLKEKYKDQYPVSFLGEEKIPSSEKLPESNNKESGGLRGKISEKEIRDVYDSLPDRYSDFYEKHNPEAVRILRHSLEVIDQQNLVGLLIEAAKKDRHLFKKIQEARITIASRYGIKVYKWNRGHQEYFRDRYNYCLYLIDYSGKEVPLKFKNYPSYCLYMMYVLDKLKKGNEASSLSLKENREEFNRLFKFIFNIDPGKIDSLCEGMFHRKRSDTFLRKGRLDDYIKDINDTLEEMVGSPDSLILKIGHDKFIDVPQNNIEIDENLKSFNFI